jgi:hypothetical protein
LPVVEAPKLDGSEAVASPAVAATNKETSDPIGGSGSSTSPSRSLRFVLLAASVAFAAALGSLSASGFAHLWSGAAASSNMAEANALQAMKAELAELSSLKASLDSATRSSNSQFSKIADRLDRVERAEVEPTTKIGHIADAVDRLEKRSTAAPETTGSIASTQPSPAPAETKLPDKVLQDWIVQDVRGGHVLVASRYGGVFEVVAGAVLPGLGRVETIKRQDGQWVVVTGRGLITER